MGFFSDLLKDKAVKGAVDKLKEAAQNAAQGVDPFTGKREPAAAPAAETARKAPASGDSWGDEMPAEENQFNFGGSYDAYFRHVFAEDFPDVAVAAQDRPYGRGKIYTLTRADGKKAVVEVMSESSSAQTLRRQCERDGTPYLRFYYDHDGWWNTRSYVKRRVADAVG